MHIYFIRWEILISVYYYINKVAIQYGVSIKESDTSEEKHNKSEDCFISHSLKFHVICVI